MGVQGAILLEGKCETQTDEVGIWFGLLGDPGDGGQVMVFVGDKGVDKTATIEGHGYATDAYQEYECQERDW